MAAMAAQFVRGRAKKDIRANGERGGGFDCRYDLSPTFPRLASTRSRQGTGPWATEGQATAVGLLAPGIAGLCYRSRAPRLRYPRQSALRPAPAPSAPPDPTGAPLALAGAPTTLAAASVDHCRGVSSVAARQEGGAAARTLAGGQQRRVYIPWGKSQSLVGRVGAKRVRHDSQFTVRYSIETVAYVSRDIS